MHLLPYGSGKEGVFHNFLDPTLLTGLSRLLYKHLVPAGESDHQILEVLEEFWIADELKSF